MKMFDVTECSMSLIMSALVSVCSCVSLANSEDIHEYPWFQSACQILICYLLSHMLFCIYHEGFLSPKIRVWIGHHTVSIIAIRQVKIPLQTRPGARKELWFLCFLWNRLFSFLINWGTSNKLKVEWYIVIILQLAGVLQPGISFFPVKNLVHKIFTWEVTCLNLPHSKFDSNDWFCPFGAQVTTVLGTTKGGVRIQVEFSLCLLLSF